MENLTEIQKAEQVIAEARKAKDAEFAEKFDALLKEYGKEISYQTQVIIRDKK